LPPEPAAGFAARWGVSRETLTRLSLFVDLVQRWNPRVNLVSKGDLDRLWDRHISDSLQLTSLLPPGTGHAIDLGSGGGFPAIPLAIASGLRFDLIESDHRKASFLREAGRVTGASVTVHAVRAEAATVEPAPLVTARALASVSELLSLSGRLLTPDGACLFPKGARVDAELTEAAKRWHMRVERFTSQIEPTGVILRISEITRAPSQNQNAGDREPEGRGR
jgi:16S rRNA (guanine527-N7)-methyltransferase